MQVPKRQAHAYLHLLKKTLTRLPLTADDRALLDQLEIHEGLDLEIRRWAAAKQSLAVGHAFVFVARTIGADWPDDAETMIGPRRLDNLESCITDILRENIAGCFMETGVWRGGACIFMRAVLRFYGDSQRNVWLADSFQGLPPPDPVSYPPDRGDTLWKVRKLAVPMEQVRKNFERYSLLDERVKFLPGWFRDTLPAAPVERLALLRLDGDMYESTMVALRSLYEKVSVGGYVIVDDYGAVPACRQAVDDFRRELGIEEPLRDIDWTGVFWKVERDIVRSGCPSSPAAEYRFPARNRRHGRA